MRFRAMLALVLALLGLALVGPASSAQAAPGDPAYPPNICPTISVSTTHPAVGETITVAGNDFDPHKRVTILLTSKTYVLGTVVTDGSGAFSTDVTLPAGLTGNHVVHAKGAQGECPADPIQIVIQGTPENARSNGPAGTPAVTGSDIVGLILAAAALIGLGIVFNRRRRPTRGRSA